MDEIINRVENSNLIQVNLDDYYPEGERVLYDLSANLHEGLVLIEKDFRDFINQHDWSQYQDKYVGIICSSDAIVPLWAFMLLASKIEPYAKKVVMGDKNELEKAIFDSIISILDFTQFQDQNVIVKGCGKHPIPESVFVDFTITLQRYAKNILFGEACSSVPLYKRKK